LITLLAALVQPAAAIEVKWWGIGPTVGTIAVPTTYPVSLPRNAREDQKQFGDPLVEGTKGDIHFGAHGVLYPTGGSRIGGRALLGLGLGSPWTSYQFTLEYDGALIKDSGLQLLVGLGVGAGHERFGGTDANPDAFLVVNYFPVRAQIDGLLRDKTRAYEIGIFGEWHIAADQTYFASADADGVSGADVDGLPGALYLKVGLEATVYFGDFRTEGDTGGRKGRK
jgi:hypothetical protein